MWAKLTADPATRLYMQQPDFVNMMKDLQRNPSSLNLYLKDQRVMQALSVLLNVKMQAHSPGEDTEISGSPPQERKRPTDEAGAVKEKKREPEPMAVSEEEREIKEKCRLLLDLRGRPTIKKRASVLELKCRLLLVAENQVCEKYIGGMI